MLHFYKDCPKPDRLTKALILSKIQAIPSKYISPSFFCYRVNNVRGTHSILAIEMDVIAQETDRTRSFLIQKALIMYIKEYTDLYVVLDLQE